jgi:hypothetical protein
MVLDEAKIDDYKNRVLKGLAEKTRDELIGLLNASDTDPEMFEGNYHGRGFAAQGFVRPRH